MTEELAFNPSENVLPTFITPVGRFSLPRTEDLNLGLSAAILRRADPKHGNANSRPGWSSEENILHWPEPGLQVLAGHVRSALKHMILLAREGAEFAGSVKVSAWARLHEAGAHWPISHHPRTHWTCLYFPDYQPTDGDAEESRMPLVFHDPRGPAVSMMPHPGAVGLSGQMTLRPEPDLLLVFPSWLQYNVTNLEPGERLIVIGFGATLRSPGENGSPIALA